MASKQSTYASQYSEVAGEIGDPVEEDKLKESALSTPKGDIAFSQKRRKNFPTFCIHLVPIVISIALLQLSFRNVFWQPPGGENLAEILGVFQVAAKAHEILIVLSVSQIVLYYIQHQLISNHGIPFGLLTLAYRVALGSHPFSPGLFASLKSVVGHGPSLKKHSQWRPLWQPLSLVIVVSIATLIALAAGPASAIAMIPRLKWWNYHDLFLFYERNNQTAPEFSMYVTKQLFPSDVTSQSLPGPFCSDKNLDAYGLCPFAGFEDSRLAGLGGRPYPSPGQRNTGRRTEPYDVEYALSYRRLQLQHITVIH